MNFSINKVVTHAQRAGHTHESPYWCKGKGTSKNLYPNSSKKRGIVVIKVTAATALNTFLEANLAGSKCKNTKAITVE